MRLFLTKLLSAWLVPDPHQWENHVNKPEAELKALRRSVSRGTPFGSDKWVSKTVAQFGLESTLRSRGRPKKKA